MIGSQPKSNLTVCSYCVSGGGGGGGEGVERVRGLLQAINYFAYPIRLHNGDIFIKLVKGSGFPKQLIAS